MFENKHVTSKGSFLDALCLASCGGFRTPSDLKRFLFWAKNKDILLIIVKDLSDKRDAKVEGKAH